MWYDISLGSKEPVESYVLYFFYLAPICETASRSGQRKCLQKPATILHILGLLNALLRDGGLFSAWNKVD
jgi:hypothetical protein